MDNIHLIKEAMHPYFHMIIENGKYKTKNKTSFYGEKALETGLTYDVSNQKTNAQINEFGGIQQLAFYQNNFLTEEKPGVWVNKQFTATQQLEISLKVNGQLINWNDSHHRVSIDLLHDSIPRIIHTFEDFCVYLVPFCPILGNKRLSMLAYNVWVENKGATPITVELLEVPLYQNKYSDQQNILISQSEPEIKQIPAQKIEQFIIAFVDPNCYEELLIFKEEDTTDWLTQTIAYYDHIFGNLTLDDPYLSHLYNRSLYQTFASFGMNKENQVVGSSWGSYPVTNRIWNKDMYYSSLPFVLFDSELSQQTILWFSNYGVKFAGTKFPGGVQHSLSNSLSGTLLAALYFEYSNDLSFFKKHSEVLETSRKIVDEVLATHSTDDPYLFQSIWISDAFALGKYHTGSNICLWKACEGLGNIYQALQENDLFEKYSVAATKIKAAILENMTVTGPFGEQFLEGIGDKEKASYAVSHYQKPIIEQGLVFLTDVISDNKIDLLMHDGEESDTTLIPYYQFLDASDKRYLNTMKFAASSENPTYSSDIQGITWGDESGATFPGFITVLMGALDNEQQFYQRLEELKKLADLDGSWWWWPYQLESNYGEVVRDFGCGKCGWAAGMFTTLFVTQYLGIQKKKATVIIRPRAKAYVWENAVLGDSRISVFYSQEEIKIVNNRLEPQKFVVILENDLKKQSTDSQSEEITITLAQNQSYIIEGRKK